MKDAMIIRADLGNFPVRIIDHIGTFGASVFEVKLHLQHAVIVEFGITAGIRGCLCFIRIILSLAENQVLCLYSQRTSGD